MSRLDRSSALRASRDWHPGIVRGAQISRTKVRGVFFEEAGEWSKQHNGVHASEQYAELMRHNVTSQSGDAVINGLARAKARVENRSCARNAGV